MKFLISYLWPKIVNSDFLCEIIPRSHRGYIRKQDTAFNELISCGTNRDLSVKTWNMKIVQLVILFIFFYKFPNFAEPPCNREILFWENIRLGPPLTLPRSRDCVKLQSICPKFKYFITIIGENPEQSNPNKIDLFSWTPHF